VEWLRKVGNSTKLERMFCNGDLPYHLNNTALVGLRIRDIFLPMRSSASRACSYLLDTVERADGSQR
jgi:hypothetical protein